MIKRINMTAMIAILAAAGLLLGSLCLAASGREHDSLTAQAKVSRKEYVNLPIIMYHGVLPDPSRQGDYIVSPSQLESDIVYLKKHGYQAVNLNTVIAFCEGKGELPEKPVVLTFDDGQLNNLTYALPILKKHGFCASFSVVGRYAEVACEEAEPSANYSYMDFDDLAELMESGLAEIVDHSYDMHELGERRGTLQKSSESFNEYRRLFLNDTTEAQRLLRRRLGVEPEVYAYPYGLVCPAGRTVISMLGFKATLGCEEKPNHLIKGSTSALEELHRYNRPASVTTEEFMKKALAE